MRKLATIAALTLCAGATAGGAHATVNIGNPLSNVGITPTNPLAGTPDFAAGWCGAPWLWTSPAGGTCGTQANDAASK